MAMNNNNVDEIDFRQLEFVPDEVKQSLAEDINQYLYLREQVKSMEEEQRRRRDNIVRDLEMLGIQKTKYEAYIVQVRKSERRTIDREKLIEFGVSPEILRRAETVSESVMLDIREQKKSAAKQWR